MKRKRDSGKFSVKELKPCLFFFFYGLLHAYRLFLKSRFKQMCHSCAEKSQV